MEDDKIVELFLDRDPQAITAVSSKYGSYCTAIALNILGDPQDAEECVNDALMGLWNSIPPHRPQNLATFAGKIVRNAAFNRYRSSRTQKRGNGEIPLVLDELSQLLPAPNTVETELDKKALTEAIDAFLATLPTWKRYILVQRYWYAESVAEIAAAIHKSESYTSMTLTRLRRKLKYYLTERGICP